CAELREDDTGDRFSRPASRSGRLLAVDRDRRCPVQDPERMEERRIRTRAVRSRRHPLRDDRRRTCRPCREHWQTHAPCLPSSGRGRGRIGLNVIVDEVIIDRTSWDDWRSALAGLDVVWVGIRCSPEVAEERNRARGDRFAGLARALTATVHRDARYDCEIDTTTQTPDDALSQLMSRLGY